jgi:hypothetical protein
VLSALAIISYLVTFSSVKMAVVMLSWRQGRSGRPCSNVNVARVWSFCSILMTIYYFYLSRSQFYYTRCSVCKLFRLSMWCRAAALLSASGAALSHEVPTVKWMSNQPALWTPDIFVCIRGGWKACANRGPVCTSKIYYGTENLVCRRWNFKR